MTRVLVVDDHGFVRDALAELFSKQEGFHVVGALASAALAESCCEKLHPDLLVIDVCTDGGASGLTAAEKIKKRFPEIKIVVISGFDEITYAPRAKKIGAEGFVHKHKSMDVLLETVAAVLRGETRFPEPKTIPLPQGETPLTAREMEVLRLLCQHLTYAEIAAELHVSEATVRYHKTNMLAKTGFTKAVDLVFHMLQNGWINPLS
ncbi:MAG: response regulator transcription factor [Propionibacteriaceae bacterium]|jgi:DNA-binding NarL/FixJ family response regulator|nr:response regulator transcription factor [Propionibacteriaceae bacterium]